MGFESFGVRLHGDHATAHAATEAIKNLDHAAPDPDAELTPGSPCFLVNDGQHAIELEVMETSAAISCRFTLCHPPTVDAVFIALVKRLVEILDARVEICEEVEPGQPDEFTLATFHDFPSIVSKCIAKRRAEWKAAFGGQTLGATTTQVHEKIIAPHYQSAVGKAG
jgi:hypothetical protein